MPVHIKRAYDKNEASDGMRILVDRIWPRGVSKEDAALDEWLKEISPSTELRQWFDHDPDKFGEFKKQYKEELACNQRKKAALEQLKEWAKEPHKDITLVYAAKDETHNQAVVLKEILDDL